jgi:putative transcriptional regulator
MSEADENELSDGTLASVRPVLIAKRARLIARLSQTEFARVYGIPVGTLRDWEQGRTNPDAAAVAYLTAIIHDSKAVAKAYGAAAE